MTRRLHLGQVLDELLDGMAAHDHLAALRAALERHDDLFVDNSWPRATRPGVSRFATRLLSRLCAFLRVDAEWSRLSIHLAPHRLELLAKVVVLLLQSLTILLDGGFLLAQALVLAPQPLQL